MSFRQRNRPRRGSSQRRGREGGWTPRPRSCSKDGCLQGTCSFSGSNLSSWLFLLGGVDNSTEADETKALESSGGGSSEA